MGRELVTRVETSSQHCSPYERGSGQLSTTSSSVGPVESLETQPRRPPDPEP